MDCAGVTVTLTDDALDAEVLPLEGIDLEGTPPCECEHVWVWELGKLARFRRGELIGHPCGKPSAARLRVGCGACGARYTLFLCDRHARGFRRGWRVLCRSCGRSGKCKARDI